MQRYKYSLALTSISGEICPNANRFRPMVSLRLDAVDGVLAGILPTLVSHGQHGDQRDEQEGDDEQQGGDGGANGKAFEPMHA